MVGSLFMILAAAATLASAHDQIHYDKDAYNDGQWGVLPTNHYQSISAISPEIQVNTWNKDAVSKSGSHIVLQHDGPSGVNHASPLILRTDDLSAVYTNRSFPGVANVNVHHFDGEPILSFYGGTLDGNADVGSGYIYGYDRNYREVGRLTAEHLKVGADAHEFTMTGKNTAIVTAYEPVEWDLRVYGGDQHGTVLDSIFQEIDLSTFEVLFQWRASEHFAMDLSYKTLPAQEESWDFFHITSVQKSKDGNYLVSAANMHAVYLIDSRIGRVLWTLGGKANQFQELEFPDGQHFDAPLLTMAWQHHAQFYPGRENEFTVFDNHGISINGVGCSENCSRGLHFRIDTESMTTQLLHEYLHPQGLWSISQGSVQVLNNGNVFIGWGRNPSFTEHLPDGDCIFDAQFSPWRSPATDWKGLNSYRAFKVDWTGTPSWTPDIAAEKGTSGDVTVWASWNGATEVKEWVLLGSNKEMTLNGAGKVVGKAKRDGFETVLWVEKFKDRYLRAVAIGDGGVILRASGILDLNTLEVISATYPVTEVVEPPAKKPEKGQGGKSGQSIEEPKKFGLPEVTYHDLISMQWSFGGMLCRIVVFGVGVWTFSKLF